MALGNVSVKTVDGNLVNQTTVSNEKITGLLFDVSKHPTLFTAGYGLNNAGKLKLGDVAYITSRKSAINDFGIIERVEPVSPEEENNVNLMHGIPYYHISEFFRMNGNIDGSAKLYVMFADCSANWDAIETLQRASGGTINQLGIYTEQSLWTKTGVEGEKYSLNLVSTINDKAIGLAEKHAPLSIVLCANPSNLGGSTTTDNQINLNLIPTAISTWKYVTAIFGQAASDNVSAMQLANTTHAPVGFVGAVMGCIARAGVQESIAWVQQFNLFSDKFQDIELGFGDTNLNAGGTFVSTNAYASISEVVLNDLDEKGYVFPIKYAGRENGIYVSRDQTCSNGDFRTIARNRTIHKSRRNVRAALLPYVNSPLLVNPSTGYLAASKISSFKTLVGDILLTMKNAQEISGYAVTISATQNVLLNDKLEISYAVVPIGTANAIEVTEGLALTAS